MSTDPESLDGSDELLAWLALYGVDKRRLDFLREFLTKNGVTVKPWLDGFGHSSPQDISDSSVSMEGMDFWNHQNAWTRDRRHVLVEFRRADQWCMEWDIQLSIYTFIVKFRGYHQKPIVRWEVDPCINWKTYCECASCNDWGGGDAYDTLTDAAASFTLLCDRCCKCGCGGVFRKSRGICSKMFWGLVALRQLGAPKDICRLIGMMGK